MKRLPARVGRVAMVARWRPVHRGHAAVLAGLRAWADELLIGIGSSETYNARNPFTADEVETMLRLVEPGLTVLRVPDLHDGPRWRSMVVDRFGPLDAFITANRYVRDLLRDDYEVLHPVHFVAEDARIAVDATMVRLAMARGDAWRALVPESVAAWLDAQGLPERVRREFGAEILAGGPAPLTG